MASQIQDLVMRLRMEVGDSQRQIAGLNAEIDNLKKGFAEGKTQSKEFSNSLTELNSGMELGKTIGNALSQALLAIPQVINHGQAATELSTAFNLLGGEMEALKTATGGLVSDLDLMKAANEAMLAGVKPEQFEKMAASADALGDVVGKSTKESLDLLTDALARGNDRLLEGIGIVIDTKGAQLEYAKSLGKPLAALTELEKKEAGRIAILEAVEKATERVSGGVDTAGDAWQRLEVNLANAGAEIAQAINENQELANVISRLSDAVGSVDFSFLERGVNRIASAINAALPIVDKFIASPIVDKFITGLTLNPELKRLTQISDRLGALKGREGSTLSSIGGLLSEGQTSSARASEIRILETEQKAIRDLMVQRELAISQKKTEAAEYRGLEQELRSYGREVNAASGSYDKYTGKVDKKRKATSEFKTELKSTYDLILSATGAFADPFVFDEGERATATKSIIAKEEGFRNESLGRSVDIYGDLLSAAMDGKVKDALTAMLESSALDFAANLSAGLVKSLTGIDIANLLDFSQLAPAIAQNLGSLPGLELGGIGAAAGVTANSGLNFFKDVKNGKNASLFDSGVLAPVTGGFSLLGPFAGSLFGGGSDPFKERRDALREQLREGGVTDENNEFSLFGGGKGSLTPGTKFEGTDAGAEEFVGLGNLLSIVQTGGVEEDLSSLFANALEDADSFNAALLTTGGLLERMGYDAQDVQNALIQAYSSGEISIEEFNAAMEQSRQLITDDLESIDAAVLLLTDSFDGPARDSVKALELTFKEFRDAGIQDSEAMFSVIKEKFGEQAVPIFERLKAKGINQFTDFSTLTNEQLGFIFNELIALETAVGKVGGAAVDAGRKAESGLDPLTKKLGRIKSDADDARAAVRRIGEA